MLFESFLAEIPFCATCSVGSFYDFPSPAHPSNNDRRNFARRRPSRLFPHRDHLFETELLSADCIVSDCTLSGDGGHEP